MNPTLLYSILTLGSIGLLFGAGLAYAARKFAVEIDEKVEHIINLLPGANCGACGLPGCSAYAEAVVAGRVPPTRCTPGGIEVSTKIAHIMGITEVDMEEAKVAVVQCQGGKAEAVESFVYYGIEDCSAAELIGGGHKACQYGCLGFGSCVRACPFDAMYMNDNGLPVVIEDKCTGCGVCVTTCPRGIMAMIPRDQKIFLGCVSLEKAKAVKSVCKVGCFACKICATQKVAPNEEIVMEGNLPVIKDRKSPSLFTALEKCPTNSYVFRGDKSELVVTTESTNEAISEETQ
jgi:electron transport complex protein RnfB